MNILILGGNGFIGFQLAAHLLSVGHNVTCIGRNVSAAKARLPDAEWVAADIGKMTKHDDWMPHLKRVDCVINASGALQDSPRDNVTAVQSSAMVALFEAARHYSKTRVLQISANTDHADRIAGTFLASKRKADTALADSDLDYQIIRPTLVIGRNAYGGSALIRAAAAFPGFAPISFPDTLCQTTDLNDLCKLVQQSVEAETIGERDIAIAGTKVLPLKQIILQHRSWLGISNQRTLTVPPVISNAAAKLADLAGWAGWRSPLRTTAMEVLRYGVMVSNDQKSYRSRDLNETLTANPASFQDLWAARLYLLKPLGIIALSAFWLLSGIIAMISFSEARDTLVLAGFGGTVALIVLLATAALDCILGIAVLFRRYARMALLAMIGLSSIYLVSASLLTPSLWLDPLGPLVKVMPSIFLTLFVLATLEER